MDIIFESTGFTKRGSVNYYFKVISNDKEYSCSIEVYDREVLTSRCTCVYGSIEFSRTRHPRTNCKHIKLAKEYLKNKGII